MASPAVTTRRKRTVVFLHPDLGIGGAERLVIDAAVGLQNAGHKVVIFTSHCDRTHCFDEARDGTLDVRVRGNYLIPPSLFSRFAILCAILRQLHLLLTINFFTSELLLLNPTVFFIDQLSAGTPILRFLFPNARILFYCHFPDKLLAQRGGLLKQLYRVPFDWLESFTTGAADTIVVNSAFTKGIFGEAFPGLRKREPVVVYPCVDTDAATKTIDGNGITSAGNDGARQALWRDKKVILSINRFERKKDVGLAVRAFAGLSQAARKDARLVVAGGYDLRVTENVSYHNELVALAESLSLSTATAKNLASALAIPGDIEVLFLLSVPSSLKSTLLDAASLLVYTPGFEHFGIVPLEAMLARVPVLAANTGGPTETVIDATTASQGATGWLRSTTKPAEWTSIMRLVLEAKNEAKLAQLGEAGRRRVLEHFSKEKMADSLGEQIDLMFKNVPPREISAWVGIAFVLFVVMLSGAVGALGIDLYARYWYGYGSAKKVV